MVKNPPAMPEMQFDPWVGKIPWRRAWQPTPVFLPGESHGQRSLVSYSPQGSKESDTSDTTEATQHSGHIFSLGKYVLMLGANNSIKENLVKKRAGSGDFN